MKKGTFSKVLSYVIVLLLVVAMIGLVTTIIGPDDVVESISPIHLTIGSDEIRDSATDYTVDSKSSLLVAVGYDIDVGTARKYTVKVVPTKIEGKDFDVVVDGRPFSFQAIKDLTAGFDIYQVEDAFTIKAKGGIRKILSYVYPGMSIDDCTNFAYKNMFTLLVSSGKNTVSVSFTVIEYDQAISLDKNCVIY